MSKLRTIQSIRLHGRRNQRRYVKDLARTSAGRSDGMGDCAALLELARSIETLSNQDLANGLVRLLHHEPFLAQRLVKDGDDLREGLRVEERGTQGKVSARGGPGACGEKTVRSTLGFDLPLKILPVPSRMYINS